MTIIGARKISYTISGIFICLSIIALLFWGLKLGIDFTGGALLEVEFNTARPPQESINALLRDNGIDHIIVQPTGKRGVLLRFQSIGEDQHQTILSILRKSGEISEKRFDSIGPTIGSELRRKSFYALAIVLIMIVLYIWWAFRQVSYPIASWKYGITAVIALLHDIIVPLGVFSALGRYYNIEIDTLFVTAILTVLGFSVHDTIVVFDRIRENLRKQGAGEDFELTVDRSIQQTIARSINTSFTVLLVMATLFFLGGVSTKYFALTILIGVLFGTYSSIFIASALLVTWYRFSSRRS